MPSTNASLVGDTRSSVRSSTEVQVLSVSAILHRPARLADSGEHLTRGMFNDLSLLQSLVEL